MFDVRVEGLAGGHSGINISEDRGNAVKMAAGIVEAVLSEVPGARLVSMAGGDKRNAIPRECFSTLAVPATAAAVAQVVVERCAAELKREYGAKEDKLAVVAGVARGAGVTEVRGAAIILLLGLLAQLWQMCSEAPPCFPLHAQPVIAVACVADVPCAR